MKRIFFYIIYNQVNEIIIDLKNRGKIHSIVTELLGIKNLKIFMIFERRSRIILRILCLIYVFKSNHAIGLNRFSLDKKKSLKILLG